MFAKKEYCGSHHFNMTSSINRKNEYNELNLFQCLCGHLKKNQTLSLNFPEFCMKAECYITNHFIHLFTLTLHDLMRTRQPCHECQTTVMWFNPLEIFVHFPQFIYNARQILFKSSRGNVWFLHKSQRTTNTNSRVKSSIILNICHNKE